MPVFARHGDLLNRLIGAKLLFSIANGIFFCYNKNVYSINPPYSRLSYRKLGNSMRFFLEFLRQKTPKSGTEASPYFRNALSFNEKLLAIYFIVCFLVLGISAQHWAIEPVALFVATVACIMNANRMSQRINTVCYSLISVIWCVWCNWFVGWHYSAHLLLLPVLLLTFFNIYNPPWLKIAVCVALFAFRMFLFFQSNIISPALTAERAGIIFQIVNSVVLFLMLSCDAIIFSSSIQATERKLRLDNQVLHKEAGTDVLTQLPNRRSMIDVMESYQKTMPQEAFSVAIADIDFFKKVNDTFGHNCGDYTLKTLAELFRKLAGTDYSVCRWGGEEFCFFLPGKNIDEAWNAMFEVCNEVKKLPLRFEGNDFSVTITIGIEENDFRSSMEEILDRADKKLYMGKISGRDRVVM